MEPRHGADHRAGGGRARGDSARRAGATPRGRRAGPRPRRLARGGRCEHAQGVAWSAAAWRGARWGGLTQLAHVCTASVRSQGGLLRALGQAGARALRSPARRRAAHASGRCPKTSSCALRARRPSCLWAACTCACSCAIRASRCAAQRRAARLVSAHGLVCFAVRNLSHVHALPVLTAPHRTDVPSCPAALRSIQQDPQVPAAFAMEGFTGP